ncbi:uncharacterized protein LOC128878399 [Hylaeus volcanicus]|uniref:uncharacterized protein LOC128878399 n=1 Tax=Hylaeus volcanicus TaxID=313075 RepID=UPI0023B878B4|nr:uncharacterized protein LOC128878399 [Hylaeus volcanicus]XP_053982536.1 uncharacterized protein LOC128878399 [Hylaeus volcanicus]
MMTPLPRWVLLALLLAGAEARPGDYACVRLCHAQDRGLDVTGVCDHQQRLVLQFSGGRYPTQRLLRLCLIPCSGLGSRNDTVFDGSQICRVIRESLIYRQGCSCKPPANGRSWGLRANPPWSKKLNPVNGLLSMLTKIARVLAAVSVDHANEPGTTDLRDDKMKFSDRLDNETDFVDAEIANPTTDAPFGADWTEDFTDWEMWCMAQCDNGRCGNSCNLNLKG